MIILTEEAKTSLKEAVSKENINGLSEHKLLSEAYEIIVTSKKENNFDSFTERCEWVAGNFIPGITPLAQAVLKYFNACSMKIEMCADGKLLLDNVNITGNTKSFILMYLTFILSINDATAPTTEGFVYEPDENILVFIQQTSLLYKEMIRLCYLNNTVYNFDMEVIKNFYQKVLMKNIHKSIAMPIATLAMLLLLDIDYCDTNTMLLLLLSRSTKCLQVAMKSYIYAFVTSAGKYMEADTVYLADVINAMITRKQLITINS